MTETVEVPEPIARLSRSNLRLVVGLCVTLACLAAAGIIALAYKHSNDALRGEVRTSQQAKDIATCVNDILGARGPLSAADTNAQVDIFDRLQAVLTAPTTKQADLYEQFLTHLHADVAVLLHDQNLRASKPLGHC